MVRNFTTGSVLKNIGLFSLPYFFSYFLQTLYGMADLFIIGQFEGAASITAVSVGSQVMHMITVMIVGLAMGTTVCIAQAVGAEDRERVARNIGNTTVLFLVVSLVLSLMLVHLIADITGWMATPAEAVAGTEAYLWICFIGIPFITAYNIISAIFRGLGDARTPMYIILLACLVNIGLDYLFMGYFHFGPAGAALGTTISQAASVLLGIFFMKRDALGAWVTRQAFRPRRAVMGGILRIGVPIALQDGFIQIAFLVITVIANGRGLTDAAAVGIVEKIISFIFLVPSSMLSTVSALGAQNIGAGMGERAIKTLHYAMCITVGYGVFVAAVVQFLAPQAVALFTSDAAVVAAGADYFRGYVFDTIFAGVHFSFSGYFCACGRSELSFLHNVVSIVSTRIPLVYLTSVWFPATLFPMGLATVSGSLVSVAICLLAFAYLRRKERQAGKEELHVS